MIDKGMTLETFQGIFDALEEKLISYMIAIFAAPIDTFFEEMYKKK